MQFDEETTARIEAEIHSDSSPVGIDAKKTHVLILAMLETIDKRMATMETRLGDIDKRLEAVIDSNA